MKLLFYLGHPAHFHLFRPAIGILKDRRHDVMICIKKKDVLETLVCDTGWAYTNINPRGRRDNLLSIGIQMIRRDIELYRICRRSRPVKMFGTAPEITHVGRLLGIHSVVLNEDDSDAIPLFSWLAFPFAHTILCPNAVPIGRWEKRKTGYAGFHELAYLHPRYFTPDPSVRDILLNGRDRYFIVRFSGLGAHHDIGIKGITDALAREVIARFERHGAVYVSSERPVAPDLERYRMPLSPAAMHSALHFADLYVGDSQTMAAEAAILGTPSVRFSDFAGRLSYLARLENEYRLAFSFKTGQSGELLSRIDRLLAMPDLKSQWLQRRKRLLDECIDLTGYLVGLAEAR